MIKTIIINSTKLTSECWSIQFQGIKACKDCEFKDTSECGGEAIIKKIVEGKYPYKGIGVEQ